MNDLDMKCPQCGHTEDFQISCSAVATIDREGVQDHTDMEYDSASICWCKACNHDGTVADFQAGVDA